LVEGWVGGRIVKNEHIVWAYAEREDGHGQVVTVRLARGRLGARVTKVDGGEQDGSA
jgi:hypothetical protein